MADSTTNLDTISSSQASKEVTANALYDAGSPATLYGRRASTTTALTWGFYGGYISIAGVPTAIANGTVALTGSTTNYVVALRSTGVVSTSTATTNWNSTLYIRLYAIVTGVSSVTSYTDHRSLIIAESSTTVSDGDKGDITVSSSGTVWTIDNDVVTYAKMQNVSATDKVLGRSTAGAGDVEEIACTASGRDMIGAATVAAQTALLDAVVGDSGTGGTKGLVPAPAAGDAAANKYLKADGTWTTVAATGGVAADAIWDAAGDLAVGTGADTAVKLPIGTGLQVLRVNAGATALEWATAGTGDALTTNPLSQFAATTSAQLAGVISDETGTGSLVFATSPTLVTPALGTPTSGDLSSCTTNTETAGNNSTQLASTAYADRLTGGTLAGAFTTLTTTANTALVGTTIPLKVSNNEGEHFRVSQWTGSATVVNYISVGGSPTGSACYMTTSGTDATIELQINSKGGGAILIRPGASTVGNFSSTGLAVTGAVSATTTIKTGGYTVATLPAGVVGDRAYVTDATAPTYLGALTGGGAVVCPVFKNASAWVSA